MFLNICWEVIRKNRKILPLGEIKRHPMQAWLATCIHTGDK